MPMRIVKPFAYQGCVFAPGVVEMAPRVVMPCSVKMGTPVFDLDHFIDPDSGQPHTDVEFMTDPATSQPITSLEGYIEVFQA